MLEMVRVPCALKEGQGGNDDVITSQNVKT